MISIKKGDITAEDTEVIVNAANSRLAGGGGVDGAIHRAAGPSVMRELRGFGGCHTGSAVITGAGELNAKRIIHAVGPVWYGGKRGEAGLLESAYKKSFELAKSEGLRTISFPAISTGIYGYPVEEAALIALREGKRFEGNFDEIRFVCFSDRDYYVYKRLRAAMESR